MAAHAGIFRPVIEDFESAVSALEGNRKSPKRKLTGNAQLTLRESWTALRLPRRSSSKPINQCIAVNCWHANDCESEAMWRLYADNGKAVAIETSVDALKESIKSGMSGHIVHIYPVKYLDFFDRALSQLIALLKDI